jgi:hypothetical protein
MDDTALEKLSEEQRSALNDELKAVYCMLDEADQVFFARTFQAKDLPTILAKKAEIIKRDRASDENLKQLVTAMREKGAAAPAGNDAGGDILSTAATVLGVGAAAALVVTDNNAFYQGVKPSDLVQPLSTEFQSASTAFVVNGNPDALTGTVFLLASSGRIPAMTINLTTARDGCEVKINELTTKGVIATIKSGAEKLIGLAGEGLNLLRRSEGGASPDDLINTTRSVLDQGSDLTEAAGNLKLKQRAWKVIKESAEAVEAAYRDRVEKERQARLALEGAWDRYLNCPTCGVPFGPEDTVCRVCTSPRPEKPLKADPRSASSAEIS